MDSDETEIDYYEQVRQKLVSGEIHVPKHKKVIKLMKIFLNEEEIKSFKFSANTIKEIVKKISFK